MLKSLSMKRAASPGTAKFTALLDDYLFAREVASKERRMLSDMADLVATKQLTAQDALRAIKGHFVQGSGWEPPHRVRALSVIEYFSVHSTIGTQCMEQLTQQKWKDRFKKAATESYSPVLQDAIVQLVFRWASAWRAHDWGIGMQQLLFDLEGEGIIESGTWKLDGGKPQVIALLSAPTSPAPAVSATGSGGRSARGSPRVAVGPAAGVGRPAAEQQTNQQYSEGALIRQAESMSQDAVALACASDALEEALAAPTREEARAPDLHIRGMDLSARCTLHLVRLQEALGRSALSDAAMASLLEVADALNTQQERWQKFADKYKERVLDDARSAAAAAARTTTTTTGSSSTAAAPSAQAAPAPDLLLLDDDDEPPAPATQPAPPAAPATVAADPFAELAAAVVSPGAPVSTSVTVTGAPVTSVTGGSVSGVAQLSALSTPAVPLTPVSLPAAPPLAAQLSSPALPASTKPGSLPAAGSIMASPLTLFPSSPALPTPTPLPTTDLQSPAPRLPVNPNNPFAALAETSSSGAVQPALSSPLAGPTPLSQVVRSWQPGAFTPIPPGPMAGPQLAVAAPVAPLPLPTQAPTPLGAAEPQEVVALRSMVQSLQSALSLANQQGAATLSALQAKHQQEVAALTAQNTALQERVAALERQLAASQVTSKEQAASGVMPGAGKGIPSAQDTNAASWVSF